MDVKLVSCLGGRRGLVGGGWGRGYRWVRVGDCEGKGIWEFVEVVVWGEILGMVGLLGKYGCGILLL